MLISLKRFYSRQKIKNKLLILHLSIVFIMMGLSVLALRFSFNSYDSLVYSQSADVLNLYSESIENELQKVEALSQSIVTEKELQENVKAFLAQDLRALEDVRERLVYHSLSESYIASINFITPSGEEHIYGNNTSPLNNKKFQDLLNKVTEKKGGIVWLDPDEGDGFLIVAREMRDIVNGTFSRLGIIMLRLNFNKLIEDSLPKSSKYKSELIILSENQPVYSNRSLPDISDIIARTVNSGVDYFSLNIGGNHVFVNRTKSGYSGWTYINMLPSRDIFRNITALRIILFLIYAGITIMAIFASIMFSRGITRPIVALKDRMKNVENGDFSPPNMHMSERTGEDEIEHLNFDFWVMIDKINTLIRENYMKQIIIQETELKALQAQMNPHFLYNTLDTIKWMAKSDRANDAAVLIESLSSLLRSTMGKKADNISIREELEILGDYISIQKFRYEERLNLEINIHEELINYNIPKLTLQPIVENSIKYALESMLEPCYIRITSIKNQGFYNIIIEDNGPGMDIVYKDRIMSGEIEGRGNGIGLKNIDDRLKLFYGDAYGLTIESLRDFGTKVIFSIPVS